MAFAISRKTTCFSSEIRDLLVHRHHRLSWRSEEVVVRSKSTTTTLLQSSTAQHAAADLAAHFTTKVEKVHTATSDAPPPVINSCQSTSLADLVPVSVVEAAKLLQSAPNKHCQSKSTFFYIAIRTRSALHCWQRVGKTNVCSIYGAVGSPAYYSLAPQVHERTLTPSLSWY